MFNNNIANMRELGITESFKLKRQVLLSATEAAEMILRVDDIIRYGDLLILSILISTFVICIVLPLDAANNFPTIIKNLF
jgi:hypothetical protein